MNIEKLYDIFPYPIQNALLSAYGYFTYNERYMGKFSEYLNEFLRNNDMSEIDIKKYQEAAIIKILKYACKNVQYYGDYCKSNMIDIEDIGSIDDLKRFPIITKEIVKNNPKKFITNLNSQGKFIKYPTGGSSGSPLIVYITKKEIQYNFALYEARVKMEYGVRTGDKVATFLGRRICPNAKGPPYWRYNIAYNQELYSIYHMNEKTMKYYASELRRQKPDLIIGYVIPIYLLAKYLVKYNQKMSVRAVFTSSEALLDNQREIIEEAFSAKVCNSYSQAECVTFITQCRNGQLHIVPEYGYCEFENLPGTDYYEVIGTTLFNYSMPLIRYRTGDYVKIEWGETCACKWRSYPIIKEVSGRSTSFIKTKSGNIVSEAPLSLIFKNFESIKEVQIVQEDIDRIVVMYEREIGKECSSKMLRQIHYDLTKILGNEMQIDIKEVERVERSSNGKYQFIKSRLL